MFAAGRVQLVTRVPRVLISCSRRPLVARLSSKAASHGNPDEIAHFTELAETWWDPAGPQRILHKMNLMRVDYIRENLLDSGPDVPGYSLDLLPPYMRKKRQFPQNLTVLDIGCGGGLLCESLARQPFVKSVLGIDVTPAVLAVAREHQSQDPSLGNLRYEQRSVEQLDPSAQFDVVTMFEVLEHVDDPAATLSAALSHVNPGGWIFLSTINRTVLSYLTTIVAAEKVLNIVPPGTHSLSKYINEAEMRTWLDERPGWQVVSSQGCMYVPTVGWERFSASSTGPAALLNCIIGKDGGNYLMAAAKSA